MPAFILTTLTVARNVVFAGEEVINPEKAIPISIILSLVACATAYIGVSLVLTLMVPYFQLSAESALAYAFTTVGWDSVRYVIAVGALCSLFTW